MFNKLANRDAKNVDIYFEYRMFITTLCTGHFKQLTTIKLHYLVLTCYYHLLDLFQSSTTE